MDNYEKIRKIMKKNKGYITSKELDDNNINRYFLTRLMEVGEIHRISRGYYGKDDYIEDEYYIIQSKSDNAIFSMTTALYLNGLSDRAPFTFDMTVPNYYGGSLQNEESLNLYFVDKSILELGAIEMKSPFGMDIKVYNKERTICDIIKNKNKIDSEIFSMALKKYVSSKNKDLETLMDYAKKIGVFEKLMNYLEVLL